jgi:chitodextrinase
MAILNQRFKRNPTEADILAAGYLPIQETDEPETKDGFVKSSKWVQTDNAIIKRWTVKRDMRPLSQNAVTNMLIAQQINTLTVDDNTALRMSAYYPAWESGNTYAVGFKVQRNGKLWRVIQAHTAQTGWEPENASALWEQINETHEGTIDDAIPYDGNMALVMGRYYTQNDTIYLCNLNTVNPVYQSLADLVGLYVEEK